MKDEQRQRELFNEGKEKIENKTRSDMALATAYYEDEMKKIKKRRDDAIYQLHMDIFGNPPIGIDDIMNMMGVIV